MRIWRFDPTALMRKASGQTDISCGITGTAERTHRDIGTGNFNSALTLESSKKKQKKTDNKIETAKFQKNVWPCYIILEN